MPVHVCALKMIDMIACLIAPDIYFFLFDKNEVQLLKVQVYESATCHSTVWYLKNFLPKKPCQNSYKYVTFHLKYYKGLNIDETRRLTNQGTFTE